MFQRLQTNFRLQLAIGAALVAAAVPAQAHLVCSWNLDSSPGHHPNVAYAAHALQMCDLVALQGVNDSAQVDALQMTLSRLGAEWVQLPPEAPAPDKAFLFKRGSIDHAGRKQYYDGAGHGMSARFAGRDGQPFVLASVSARRPADAPYDLSSYVGFLASAYPEDARNWLIVGQLGTPANDPAMGFFRRSARPIVHSVDTALPSKSLDTLPEGVRVMSKSAAPGEADDQAWVPIGSGLDIQEAGVIDYLAAIEAAGLPRLGFEEAKKEVSPFLPIYVRVGAVSRSSTRLHPVLLPDRRAQLRDVQVSLGQ